MVPASTLFMIALRWAYTKLLFHICNAAQALGKRTSKKGYGVRLAARAFFFHEGVLSIGAFPALKITFRFHFTWRPHILAPVLNKGIFSDSSPAGGKNANTEFCRMLCAFVWVRIVITVSSEPEKRACSHKWSSVFRPNMPFSSSYHTKRPDKRLSQKEGDLSGGEVVAVASPAGPPLCK